MTDMLSWMPLETVRDLGWTLIHFLWQGFFLAALLGAILPLCRSVIARHNCALAILGMMAQAPVVTFLILHDFAAGSAAPLSDSGPLASAFVPSMDGLVVLWLAGVAVLSVRAMGGWYLVQSTRRLDTLPVPAELLARCHGLQQRLAVAWPVRFALSRRITVPMVIGWLRPVILIPVSALAGLSPRQLDALILHELAHIRRFDTVSNVLLVAVETILFYHPAVWWVSRQVRTYREHCCDDLAVSACGDAALFAEALTSLEVGRATGGLALAANGGSLKDRVARLLDGRVEARRFSSSAIAGLMLLSLAVGSVAVAQVQAPARSSAAGSYLSKDKNPVTLRPIQETRSLPPYPSESLKLHEEGRVLLEVMIGTNGAVSRASVFKPSGHQRLDVAAAEHVKQHWRWHPATRGGKPVPATTRVAVDFKMAPKPAAPAKL